MRDQVWARRTAERNRARVRKNAARRPDSFTHAWEDGPRARQSKRTQPASGEPR